jgi:FemAB-related protein (PEP-CTERM system-associated)
MALTSAAQEAGSALRIALLGDGEDSARWDRYLSARTGALTDLSAWREVVREAYGIGSHFLAALQGERIVGTLGLFEISHPVFGHYLTTAVFATDGGFHFDGPAAKALLLSEARRLTKSLGADYLVIRGREGALDGFQVDEQYRTSVLDLGDGAEMVWKKLPAKTRNQVRKGQKEGFTLRIGRDQLEAFYEVFHRHMRDLGSPAHSRKFYRSVLERLGERAEVFVLRDGEQLVAGALVFTLNGTAMNYHTVALQRYNRRCPNYMLYWAMIEASCARGCRWFDMGRSRVESPNLRFKANWGAAEVPLQYNYFLGRAKRVPNLDPRNPAYRFQIAVWKKLPIWVTTRLGPRLISGLA